MCCRPVVTDKADIESMMNSIGRRLTDYDRYKAQMFRVVRDIVTRGHLLTICDISESYGAWGDDTLVTAAVEAFIKCECRTRVLTLYGSSGKGVL